MPDSDDRPPDSDRGRLTVYAAIGNSDDRLGQRLWSTYVAEFLDLVRLHAEVVHGEWHSAPDSPYQNTCACFEVFPEDVADLRDELAELRAQYGQDSVAWTVAHPTEFL
jgi:hypothetical protein